MMSIPHLFRCPISLDLFTDPVTLCTGQTYDRPSIERWLADGNLTCPVTMQRLRDPSLVPNHTLRHLIDQWLLTGPPDSEDRGSRPPQDPASPVHGGGLSLAALRLDLQSPGAGAARRLETLRWIRTLSLESDVGQSCLIQMGFFSLLLRLLFQFRPSCEPEVVEVALDCVLSLSPSAHSASLDMLKEASCLASLVRLLEHGKVKARTSLCYLLEAITASPQSEELSLVIGQTRRVLQGLVTLLNERPCGGAADAAARAISGLCSLEPNRDGAVRDGAVDALVAYLSDADPRNASRALATLELLAGLESGGRALLRNPGAVPALVKMVFRVSSDHRGSEHAVGALLSMCRSSGLARVEAVNAGALTQLLLLLQSQCSSKAKEKTRALLKLLSSMWV
ncbi:hypothetical protein Taro_034461 [Colocasia esculenta]|uniref:U-box domain-containing protein n=1 Tax=Colocasia esculenta TaxID=4460 RepID=A0A843W308_COLES|nr:hypothetical protein [Colocasia esculenta]